MDTKQRLSSLRDKRGETWKELAAALDVSDACLFSLTSGRRNPSRRLLKRITDLEDGKPATHVSVKSVVKEATEPYMSRKQVNMLEVDQRLAKISGEIAAIRELIREARHE